MLTVFNDNALWDNKNTGKCCKTGIIGKFRMLKEPWKKVMLRFSKLHQPPLEPGTALFKAPSKAGWKVEDALKPGGELRGAKGLCGFLKNRGA